MIVAHTRAPIGRRRLAPARRRGQCYSGKVTNSRMPRLGRPALPDTALQAGTHWSAGRKPGERRVSVKRWETMAVVTVAALGLLAPSAAQAADLAAGYKFSIPVTTSGNAPDGGPYLADPLLQIGSLNNNDQFTYNAQTQNT